MDKLTYMMQYKKQGFRYFARSQSREIQVTLQNPSKFTKKHTKYHEIRLKSYQILIDTTYSKLDEHNLGYWGCLIAVNVQIYLKTSSPQQANNAPKLPGVN